MEWEGKRDGFDVMGFESCRDGDGDGDGDDVMRRDAMPCYEVGVVQLWLVARRLRRWRGVPLLARRSSTMAR